MNKYIDEKEFHDFKDNFHTLIDTLNHNITELTTDVSWLKKIANWGVALLSGIFLAMVGIATKFIL